MPTPNYAPINAVVRSKLQVTAEELVDTDPDLEMEIAVVIPLVLTKVPDLGLDYSAVTGQEKTLLDGAIGRIVAANMRPVLMAAKNDGQGGIIEADMNGQRVRFAGYTQSASGSKKTLEETWADEAAALLDTILQIQRQTRRRERGARTPSSFVGLAGRRRQVEAQTCAHAIDVRDLLLPRGVPRRAFVPDA